MVARSLRLHVVPAPRGIRVGHGPRRTSRKRPMTGLGTLSPVAERRFARYWRGITPLGAFVNERCREGESYGVFSGAAVRCHGNSLALTRAQQPGLHTSSAGASGDGAAETSKKEKKKTWTWNLFSSISPKSRAILFKLCSLFFLDSLGSGMVPFSLINYYLDGKFHLPKGKLGGIMSATWSVPPFPFPLHLPHQLTQPTGSSPPSATSSPPPSPAAWA